MTIVPETYKEEEGREKEEKEGHGDQQTQTLRRKKTTPRKITDKPLENVTDNGRQILYTWE